ncbi:toprim domain-containing protein [Pseudoalteromonas sp. MMG013]|uniref:toprim domain-containing protein n=1 Tax=Pseudoalteromonas sp. MMG013 TaxID=2822687 RepID=UPI001B35D183|nr:toprim domain-containing protein [Pseudoalteromonas sp. MMG013]MBQ4864581.1 toprim domain-containing protein [Pseudoalteromonas sp. MMG013]
MYPELHSEVIPRLLNDYGFKQTGSEFMQQGVCPSCGKKELYANSKHPWVLRCGRLNKCGDEFHIKDIYPDLFESWSDRFPQKTQQNNQIVENPSAAADAYMQHGRGFTPSKIKDWYTQGAYYCGQRQIGTATVKFELPGGATWERFIDKPQRFGKMKANFVGKYNGQWWQAPDADIKAWSGKELWLTEGIFDAIALIHAGINAVSLMSCNNFPDHALKTLEAELASKKKPKLVFALDDGNAGESFTKKFVKRARKLGWEASAAQPPKGKVKLDWNELYQRDRLTKHQLDNCKYYGQLLIASSAIEKAILMHNKKGNKEFPFAFNSSLFWFKIDLDRYHKAFNQVIECAEREDEKLSEEVIKERALKESGCIQELSKCYPQALYYQENKLTDESWYYFRVDFPHDSPSVKNTFSGSQLSSGAEFKKRLLGIAPGAVFNGQTPQLDKLMSQQLYNIKRVQTTDFVGYSKEHACYVYNNVAVKDGRLYQLNDEDFFDINKLSIKTLQSIELSLNHEVNKISPDWEHTLWQAFDAKGFVALAFWFGSFFAEQIRKTHKTYPFLEIVGEPGTGKSTLLEFLWKLAGRNDYEGFDPSKSTLAARARNFAQVSNLPVVLIEGDRGDTKDAKQKGFDWDELKTAYNGRSVRARGIRSQGNETYEPPFRGSIVIAQNAVVQASEAVLQRIIHVMTDRKGQTAKTKEAAEWLERVDVDDVSGFLLKAAMHEKQVLECFNERFKFHEQWLSKHPDIKNVRIVKNHAQLCALIDAVALVTSINPQQVEATYNMLSTMAVERQKAISAEHPLVQEFWDVFDFLEGDGESLRVVDHHRDPSKIAVNLNHFTEIATERRQYVPPLTDLKRLLKSCRTRKFLGQQTVNSAVNARINNENPLARKPSAVKCWVFEIGDQL